MWNLINLFIILLMIFGFANFPEWTILLLIFLNLLEIRKIKVLTLNAILLLVFSIIYEIIYNNYQNSFFNLPKVFLFIIFILIVKYFLQLFYKKIWRNNKINN
jgi:hypothetical protein